MKKDDKDKVLTMFQWLTPITLLLLGVLFIGISVEKEQFHFLKTLVFVGTILSAISHYFDVPKVTNKANMKQTVKASFGMLGMFTLSFAAILSL